MAADAAARTERSAARAAARPNLLRHAPALTLALLLAPIAAGLAGTALPAFGYLPVLGGAALGLDAWRMLFAAPELPGALRLTLTSGIGSTLIALALAIGFAAASHGTVLARRVRALLAPLLALPHAAVAIGLAFLIAPSGWAVRLLTPWATGSALPPDYLAAQDPWGLTLTAGLVVKELPYLLLMVFAALGQFPADRYLAIGRSLGYGPVTSWLKLVLPPVYRQIRLPIFAVLAFALSVVDMALILAPSTPPPLAPLVLRWFNDPDLAMRFQASAGALLQLLLVAGVIALWCALERVLRLPWRRALAGGRRHLVGRIGRRLLAVGGFVTLIVSALAIVAMLVWSFAARWRFPDALPSEWTFENWVMRLDRFGPDLANTALIAALSSGIALALTLACLENERRRQRGMSGRGLWLIYLPLLLPQISFLFGAQQLFVALDIDSTTAAVVWSHLLFVLPYVFLSIAEPYRSVDERYRRAAACLGARPARLFVAVMLPMVARPVAIGFAVGAAVSVAQYLPTLFAGAGRIATLTTEAVSLSAGGDRRIAGVYVVMQAALPLLLFAAAILLPRRIAGVPGSIG
jgi:putative thiamine transport system permease protein